MKYTKLIAGSTGIAMALMAAVPALADESVSSSANVKGPDASVEAHGGLRLGLPFLHPNDAPSRKEDVQGPRDHATSTDKRMEKGQQRGDTMIDMRIKSLQNLLDRIAKMKLLSADTLATIQASINAEIQTLTDLKTKIASDTSTTTIKADDGSITKANRVYLIILPKARIAAAADRTDAVVAQMQALSTKLDARITAAQASGTDVSAAVSALADFTAKVADAKVQADAAVAETVNLEADNGDKTVQAANTAALKDAQNKLKAAEADLKAARADANTILGVVKVKASATTAP